MSIDDKVRSDVSIPLNSICSGQTILVSGFGHCGAPSFLLQRLSLRNIRDLTIVYGSVGPGIRSLLEKQMVSTIITSFFGSNDFLNESFFKGCFRLEMIPQGNLVERCRAGASGIPAFYSPVGRDTLAGGGMPTRYGLSLDGTNVPIEYSRPLEVRAFNGKKCTLQESINGDVALVHVYKADKAGNCIFRRTAKNFGPVFGMNAALTIVEAEIIVEVGELDPDQIDLPSIYVHHVVQAPQEEQDLRLSPSAAPSLAVNSMKRSIIAMRAAQEVRQGYIVNIGAGIPTAIPEYVDKRIAAMIHSENGIIGIKGVADTNKDYDMIDTSRQPVSIVPSGSCFDSVMSFGLIRSGRLNLTFLGALEVSETGDLASYVTSKERLFGIGGSMDLVSSPTKTKVIVCMEHTDRAGNSKIRKSCQLPLTGRRCISKIITDLAVFDVLNNALVLIEIRQQSSLEEVRRKTEADFSLSDSIKALLKHQLMQETSSLTKVAVDLPEGIGKRIDVY